jgi:hypothetical protein
VSLSENTDPIFLGLFGAFPFGCARRNGSPRDGETRPDAYDAARTGRDDVDSDWSLGSVRRVAGDVGWWALDGDSGFFFSVCFDPPGLTEAAVLTESRLLREAERPSLGLTIFSERCCLRYEIELPFCGRSDGGARRLFGRRSPAAEREGE